MPPSDQRRTKTRDRLLKAAIAVMAQEGIVGATTREIARIAGVSEVTLFRHFQNKEQLLSAVAHYMTALQAETLAHQEEWTQELQRDLLHYAQVYNAMLEDHQALVRMFIGEAQRHPEEALRVCQQAVQPMREKLIDYLRSGIQRGQVGAEVDLLVAVDSFTGMLLSGMLRRHISSDWRGYSDDRYITGCVDLFIRGISPGSAHPELPPIRDDHHSTIEPKPL